MKNDEYFFPVAVVVLNKSFINIDHHLINCHIHCHLSGHYIAHKKTMERKQKLYCKKKQERKRNNVFKLFENIINLFIKESLFYKIFI